MTAFFCWLFVIVEHPWAVRASTVGISLSATVCPASTTLPLLAHLTAGLTGDVGSPVRVDTGDLRDERYSAGLHTV